MVQTDLKRSTVLFSSAMVLPRPSRTSSTCSTILSAFNAAWVRFFAVARARGGAS